MIAQTEHEKIKQLLALGLSPSQISRTVNRSITTIYRIRDNKDAGMKIHQSSSKKLSKFESHLSKRFRSGITNSMKLYREIKEQGYKGSYALVNRFLHQGNSNYKPSIRFETEAGEQAQVDWGSFGKIEINGRIERLYCFVYVLEYSRMAYIEFTIKQNLHTLENCHIHAFEKIGIPKTIVYDNMKTVVIRREKLPDGRNIPHFNPAFFDFSEHYGFHIFACPPYWPRAKGKVEASVKYVRNNFMKGMKYRKGFTSLNELNKKAQQWLNTTANTRIHRTTEERPVDRWLKEKKYLHFPINIPAYTSSPFMARNSTKDGLIQYKSNFYSVPIEYARRKLFVKEVNRNGIVGLKIYFQDMIVAEHLVSHERGEWVVDDSHFMRESRVHDKGVRKVLSKKKIKKSSPDIGIRPLSYYDQFVR